MARLVIPIVCGVAALTWATFAFGQSFHPPLRRAGWWESSVIMQLGGHPQTITTKMCTDEAIEKKYSAYDATAAGQNCSKKEMHPTPGGFAFSSTCTTRRGGTDVSSGTVTGDLKTAFHVELTTHPSSGPERHTTIDAKWVGSCPAGRSPGDTVMPNGMVVNIDTGRMSQSER